MFGSSPDETAYCRLYLNRETTADALTMMQPQLLAYTLEVHSFGMYHAAGCHRFVLCQVHACT